MDGAVLVLGADPNPTAASRVGYATVACGAAAKTVKVTQAAGPSAGTRPWAAPLEATVLRAAEWDTGLGSLGALSYTDDASWLTAGPGRAPGEATASPTSPNTGAARTALVTVKSGSKTVVTFVVFQAGAVPGVSAGTAAWAAPKAGGSTARGVTVKAIGLAGPLQWRASTDASWLHVPAGWADTGTSLTVAADANTTGVARAGTVWVETAAGRTEVMVTQAK
jgi:hypothetical protein